jgi:hypothetical protein
MALFSTKKAITFLSLMLNLHGERTEKEHGYLAFDSS